MPFCPSCRTEYVAGKRWCTDCAMELVEEMPDDVPAQDGGEGVRGVELCQADSQTEMELILNQLHTAGIPTAQQLRGVAIYVPEAQLEHARHVLSGESAQPTYATVGLSELHRIRLICSDCELATTVDLLEKKAPLKCECGHIFDLDEARPILDRYTEIVRTMAEKEFEIELELPAMEVTEEE